MNSIININKDIVIDSREIAELTGKEHRNVCRDITAMLNSLGGSLNFGHTYIHKQNKQEFRCFKLPKRETLILVSGYSVELRAKIIDRLEYLEQQNKPALPQSFADALLLAYNQQKQLEEQAPKVAFFDTVTQSDSWLTFKEVANILNIKELGRNNLTKRLRELGYINDFNKPYQKYLDQKLFKVVETLKGKNVYTSTVVSQKGIDKLSKVLNS